MEMKKLSAVLEERHEAIVNPKADKSEDMRLDAPNRKPSIRRLSISWRQKAQKYVSAEP